MSEQFPNGKRGDNEMKQDARLTEAIRKAAQETMPDAEFVARLESRLREQDGIALPADGRANAYPYDMADKKQQETIQFEEIPAMQAQKVAVQHRDKGFIPLPLAAAVTAAIAIGALILMMNLNSRPNPPDTPNAVAIQISGTPTATLSRGQLLATANAIVRSEIETRAANRDATGTPTPFNMERFITEQYTLTAQVNAEQATLVAQHPVLQTLAAIYAAETATAMPLFPQQTETEAAYRETWAMARNITLTAGARHAQRATEAAQTRIQNLTATPTVLSVGDMVGTQAIDAITEEATTPIAQATANSPMQLTPTADPVLISATVPVLVRAIDHASVRETPDLNGSVISVILRDSWYAAVTRFDPAFYETGLRPNENLWIQIEYAPSPTGYGWVHMSEVTAQGNWNRLPVAGPVPSIPIGGWLNDFSTDSIRNMRVNQFSWVAMPILYQLADQEQQDIMVATIKALITSAQANGFKVMLTVVSDPQNLGLSFRDQTFVERFAAFTGEIAALNPDAIQIWHHPNVGEHWVSFNVDASSYVQMLVASYSAIKSANPDVMVVTAALAPITNQELFPGQVVNDDVYYRLMEAAGAADFADCIGVEYLEGVVAPTESSGDPRGDDAIYYLVPMIQRAAAPFRESGLPICVTRLGYASFDSAQIDEDLPEFDWARGTSWSEQYNLTQQAIETLASLSSVRVEIAMIYRMDPLGNPESDLYATWRTNPPPQWSSSP